MAIRLPREKQLACLQHLVEGNTIRSTERLLGVHRDTVMRLMVRFGTACQTMMDQRIRGLTVDKIEIDETWTFCGRKNRTLSPNEKLERYDLGDQYLWVALEADSKLVISHVVGKRSGDNARRLIRDLSERLVFPTPHEADLHGYRPICQITTDMYIVYPEAIDQFFGPYVKYGQIKKDYRSHDMPGRYTPAEIVATQRKGIFNIEGDELYGLSTSYVERFNLTNRVLQKRFTRLSLGFSKKLDNLKAACSMFMGYYNFVWRTRRPGKSGRYRPPAAMMAGVTSRLWSFEDLYDEAMAA
ncbi:MAG: hypothetical protein IID44_00310 [Planctomycetes bacterium]|nr:hypothetical protein [Planctomycetota bacterium]